MEAQQGILDSNDGLYKCGHSLCVITHYNLVVDKELEDEAGFSTFWLIKKNHYKYVDDQHKNLCFNQTLNMFLSTA